MAKFYGSAVKTGKLGGSVFAIRNGEVIERQYQPVVSNPSTQNQVAARAKLKLMSQLSAVLAPVIAIPRLGAVSSRNRFVSINYPTAKFVNNQADVNMLDIKLTKSVVGMPGISAVRTEQNLSMQLNYGDADLSRVVYVVIIRQPDDSIRLVGSVVVTTPGAENKWPATLNFAGSVATYVYAYGVRDNTEAARAMFSDLAISAEDVANIIVYRSLLESDITVTKTVSALATENV